MYMMCSKKISLLYKKTKKIKDQFYGYDLKLLSFLKKKH